MAAIGEGRQVSLARTVTVGVGGNTIEAGEFWLLDGFFGLAVQSSNPVNALPRDEINLNIEPATYETNQIVTAEAFNKGDLVYYDAAAKKLTTTSASGANRLVGRVTKPKNAANYMQFYLTAQAV
jgi:hypothetical protein